jgi:predicted RNA-binding Zn-ribbon protein involved in translation (DUF1610 family)
MPTEQASFVCPQCKESRLFTRGGVNNLVHAVITLFLCGLWIPVWIITTMSQNNSPYYCSKCGYHGTSRQIYAANHPQSAAGGSLKSIPDLLDGWTQKPRVKTTTPPPQKPRVKTTTPPPQKKEFKQPKVNITRTDLTKTTYEKD